MNSDAENKAASGETTRGPLESKPAAKPPAQGAGTPFPRRRPGDKPFVPFSRFEDIVVRCGHVEKFGLLPEGKDRFREGRRQKALGRDCKACREKRHLVEQEAAEQRRLEKEKAVQQTPRTEKAPRPQTERLPDGSQFEVRYDGTKEQWHGTLTVPNPGGESATFTASKSGLFPLLSHLDKQYRASLK